MIKKTDFKDVVEQLSELYNGKYSYELHPEFDGLTNKSKIYLICEQHGRKPINISNHKAGFGCSDCAKDKRFDDKCEAIKSLVNKIYSGKFSVVKVHEGSTNKIKVTLNCSEHGEFTTDIYSLRDGVGCVKCNRNKYKEDSYKKFHEIHVDTYKYIKFFKSEDDTNNSLRVLAECKKHGEFPILVSKHASGKGCPKCAVESTRLPSEEFIERSRIKHNNKYSYERVIFVNTSTNVIINCPEHGYFKQTPNNHLAGKGCSLCAKTGFDKDKPAWFYVYTLNNGLSNYVGFGISNNLQERIKKHKTSIKKAAATGELQYMLYFENGSKALELEDYIKANFERESSRIYGFIYEALHYKHKQSFESYIDSLGLIREYPLTNKNV